VKIIAPTGVYGFDQYGTAVYWRGRDFFLSHRDDDYEYPLGRLLAGTTHGEVIAEVGYSHDAPCVDLRPYLEADEPEG